MTNEPELIGVILQRDVMPEIRRRMDQFSIDPVRPVAEKGKPIVATEADFVAWTEDCKREDAKLG